MKKKILLMALLHVVLLCNSFAFTGGKINDRVINSFKKEFVDASNVQWEKGNDLIKVTFTQNEQVLYAFYSEEGNLLALSRNLAVSQLPINLFKGIQKFYRQYWVTDLFEIVIKNETAYYITLQNGDQTLVLKSYGTNGWDFYSRKKVDTE